MKRGRFPGLFTRYGHQLLWVVLARTLRGSLLIGGALMVIGSTNTWQFVASSFAAHDIKRAAAWSPAQDTGDVLMVAIDDTGFDSYFGGRSPLDKARFIALARTLDEAAPQAEAIVVDIDLSPAPDEPTGVLPAFFAGLRPGRWIVADPATASGTVGATDWDRAMCAAGVRLAHPYVPTAFGYTQGTHQYEGSLSQAALSPAFDCAAHRGLQGMKRMPAPLDAATLSGGLVVPFEGDLAMLRMAVESMKPRYIVVGGTWGRQDIVGTPFGDRFGLQLHAAAIAGGLRHARIAPYAVQLVWAWVVLAVLSLLVDAGQQWLRTRVDPWASARPGHRLLSQHLWPLAVTLLTVAGLLGASELGAMLHARTGYWVPTSTAAAVTITALMFVWNWGRTAVIRQDSVGATWLRAVWEPALDELRGMVVAGRLALHPSADGTAPPAMSRPRALAESALSCIGFLMQTVFPIVSLYFALNRPL